MNQDTKVVKISDIVENQIPEFILSENPNFAEFLKQYYISQEYQGAVIDITENLSDYKNVDSFDTTNLIQLTTLTEEVSYFDDVINVDSTYGWPPQYGLLKIGNEIITYTGKTTTSFTGCIRGFSGIETLSDPDNPGFLKFSTTEVAEHIVNSEVINLSNLFLLEFFRKIKYQFAPGFEELEFDPRINAPNFISKVKNLYQTKGTDEAFKILFKVLYGEDVKVIKPKDFLFTPSDDGWIVVQRFIGESIEGNALKLNGQTLYQDKSNDVGEASGSIYKVSSVTLQGNQYYNIDVFAGYSNNLNPKGSIFGQFEITPKTYCDLDVAASSSTIHAVSTIGFPQSGTIYIGDLAVSYTDKTNTEFLNCQGITDDIKSSTPIYAGNFTYSYEEGDSSKVVKIRLLNTLSEIDKSNTILASKGDLLRIDNIGQIKENVFTQSLMYNVPSIIFGGKVYNELPVGKFGVSKSTGVVRTKYPHYLKNGDIVEVFSITTNQKLYDTQVSNINSETNNQFTIGGVETLVLNHTIKIKRKVFKTTSSKYPEINQKFSINIQDSYEDHENYYITSNAFNAGNIIPYKKQFEFILSTPSSGISSSFIGEHSLYDGELVTVVDYETVNVGGTPGFKNNIGIYTGLSLYAKKIDPNTVKLTFTKQDILNENYINFAEKVDENNNTTSGYISGINLISAKLYNSELTSSKLFKKFPKNVEFATKKVPTRLGSIGVLVNGLEIQNYKSFDRLYAGEITSVDVLSKGDGYSLVNPPQFRIDLGEDEDTILVPELKGKLDSIAVLDPGFDYIETPIITLKGGGNSAVRTEVKLKKIQRELEFNSEDPNQTIITNPFNKFVFGSPHRLSVGDAVIYEASGNSPIGNLNNNSIYYIFDVGAGTSFKLASNREDALAGIGTVDLGSGGSGIQKFISVTTHNVVDKINIIDVDTEFKYKKLPLSKSNINHYDDIINFDDHGFINGDEVSYSYSGTSILSTTQYYYVIKLDANRFKLSINEDLTSSVSIPEPDDSSIHYISYSPIRTIVKGRLSVSGISTIGLDAEVHPVVKGSIEKINVINSKTYQNNIINFENPPRVDVVNGRYASFKPIISNGKIIKIVILNPGQNYFNNVDLEVVGSGVGAKLYPIISNGQIVDVKILSPGIGYDQFTKLNVKIIGKNAAFKANINYWTFNEVSKYSSVDLETGILNGQNYYQGKSNIAYYYLTSGLKNQLNIQSNVHSKIIGWAYDGCPIYGPYAYENINGTGNIVEMTSSYKNIRKSPIIIGSENLECIEDYSYEENYGTLDEFNGRYCVTPEFPDGVYAYFATAQFPYFIGQNYKYSPKLENFELSHSQDLDFNELGIIKHSFPYYIEDKQNYYDYFDFYPNRNKEDLIVLSTLDGGVNDIEIISPGEGYVIGDKIYFDDEGTDGFGAFAEVSKLSGVGISSIYSESITSDNIQFIESNSTIIGISTIVLDLIDNYYINISNISNSEHEKLNGIKKINTQILTTTLTEELPSNSGIVTSIKISDSITQFDIDSSIKIGTETLLIIGFDYTNNSIIVKREDDLLSAAAQSSVDLLVTKFTFTEPSKLNLPPKNESYYFDSDLVSVGGDDTPGSGQLVNRPLYGTGKSQSKFVRSGGIWLPNHKFKNGELVTYSVSPENTSPIITNEGNLDSIENLYIVDLGNDIIGLVSDKTKINSTSDLLYFTDPGFGPLHKLMTNRIVTTGSITFNESTIYTNSSHGLSVGDIVELKVKPKDTVEFLVSYDDSTAKLKIDSQNNPKLTAYRNQILEFNVSSPTLTQSIFKLYADENFENEYIGNPIEGIEVIRTSDRVILTINDGTPSNLYYNIETDSPLYQDLSVDYANTISIITSKYNSTVGIASTTSNSFTVNLSVEPENANYVAIGQTILSYDVIDSNTTGPISDTRMIFYGRNYKSLPTISSIGTSGSNAILIPTTNSIGKINKVESISNIVYSSDKTLKPFSNLYSTLYLSNNYTVSNLKLEFGGLNYLSPPQVKIYNEITNQIYDSFSAFCELNNSSINEIVIANPGSGLLRDGNKVIFTENTNGLKILESYSTQISPDKFLVSLRVETPISGFSTSNPVPFELGDKIFVEGVVSLGFGYNSSNYSYNTFDVVGIVSSFSTPNETVIRYELPKNPGVVASYEFAYVINEKNLPICNVSLSQSEFFANEPIENTKIVNNPDKNTSKFTVNVYDSSQLNVNDTIEGINSKSKATIIKIDPVSSDFSIGNGKQKSLGWENQRGNLSEIVQKLPDNDYYQNFSYSLKSTKEISKWNPAVSDIAHIAGLSKFSDVIVESVGTGTSIRSSDSSNINLAITSYGDINTINNFDLVLEDVDDHNKLYSEVLTFKTQKLSDYLLCLNNRVLSIDDISLYFNNDTSFVSIVIDELPISSSVIAKYISFIESTTSIFGDFELPQFTEIFVTKQNSSDVNIVSYSYFEDIPLGIYSANVVEPNVNLEFIPFNIFNIISSKTIRETIPLAVGITTVNYGNVSNVSISTSFSAEVSPTEKKINLCNLSDCKSGTAFVGLSKEVGNIEEFLEFTFLYDGQMIDFSVYATNEVTNLGEVGISTGNSNNIELTYTPIADTDTYLYANLHLLTNNNVSPQIQSLDYGRLNSSRIQFTASTLDPVAISTITSDYGASKYVIEIEKTVGVTTERSIIQINSIHYDIIPDQEKYLNNINYGIIGNYDDIEFSTIFDSNSGTYTLAYYPNALATYDIKFYEKNILRSTNPLL